MSNELAQVLRRNRGIEMDLFALTVTNDSNIVDVLTSALEEYFANRRSLIDEVKAGRLTYRRS